MFVAVLCLLADGIMLLQSQIPYINILKSFDSVTPLHSLVVKSPPILFQETTVEASYSPRSIRQTGCSL